MKKQTFLLGKPKNMLALILAGCFSCSAPTPDVEDNFEKQDSIISVDVALPEIEKKTENTSAKKEKATTLKNTFKGKATFYNDSFQDKKTASGALYDKNAFTAAVKLSAIPVKFGTVVEVLFVKKNKTVLVKVNDKMSENSASVIDLSFAAALEIGLIKAGRAKVVVTILPQDSATMARFAGQRLK